MTFYHQIEDAEAQAKNRKTEYLTRFGWKLTCNTPGSFWVWVRDFADLDDKRRQQHETSGMASIGTFHPYGVVMAPTDLAVSMTTRCLDQQTELDGEE